MGRLLVNGELPGVVTVEVYEVKLGIWRRCMLTNYAWYHSGKMTLLRCNSTIKHHQVASCTGHPTHHPALMKESGSGWWEGTGKADQADIIDL